MSMDVKFKKNKLDLWIWNKLLDLIRIKLEVEKTGGDSDTSCNLPGDELLSQIDYRQWLPQLSSTGMLEQSLQTPVRIVTKINDKGWAQMMQLLHHPLNGETVQWI